MINDLMRNTDPYMICNFLLCFRALGIPATDYVMEGRNPVRKLGGLSLPLDSPARETLALLHKNGWEFASWLVSQFHPAPFFLHGLLIIQPGSSRGGIGTRENDWQVSVGVSQCLREGSCLYSGTDGQTGSCHNLQPLLQGRIFTFSPVNLFSYCSLCFTFSFSSRMKLWTSDVSISALQPCQDLFPSDHFFTQLLL